METKEFESEIWIGRELGKYKILKLLGFGGMGAVYLAFHTLLDKNVVLKILFPSLVHSGSNSLARFIREAKSAARLEHPNIVQIYDIDMVESVYFIVMQFIDGQTLLQLLEEKETFGVKETIEIALKVGEALDFAHKRSVVHRDIKPANIMVTRDGQVKLTDFGTARWVNTKTTLTGAGDVLGTPVYNSPEAILGESVDARSDLYSLGITMFHMLAGVPPYTGKNPITVSMQHLESPIPSIIERRSEVPPELNEVLRRLMAKKAEERFASAEELIRVLDFCATRVDASKTAKKPDTTRRPILEETPLARVETLNKARVLVVDDSPMMCKAIERALQGDPACEVVGIAHNGEEALDVIPQLNPNVITLDVNMPVMDGLSTLKRIMVQYPMPVIMLSAFTYDGALTTFHCISYGAVGFIWKSSHASKEDFKKELLEKVRNCARLELITSRKPRIVKPRETDTGRPNAPAQWVVVMGAGESGYHAYLKFIPHIPKNIPCALIIVQEMPNEMADVFADYLNHYSRILVEKLTDRAPLLDGVCYVTNHLSPVRLKEEAGQRICVIESEDKQVGRNVFGRLLSSAVDIYGHRTVGVVLTGKDRDAVEGLRQVKEAGGMVLAQKPETCLDPDVAQLVIDKQIVLKPVLEVDIPSLLWHFLKKKHSGPYPPGTGPKL